MNRFFTRLFSAVDGVIARARPVKDEFTSIEQGFTAAAGELDRALRAPVGETLALLPVRSARANLAAYFDANGDVIGTAAATSAQMDAAVAAASAAASSAASAAASAASLSASTSLLQILMLERGTL